MVKPSLAAAALIAIMGWLAPAQSQPVEKQRGPGQTQDQTSPQNQRQPVQNQPAPAPSGKSQLAPFNPNKKNQVTPPAANPAPAPVASKPVPPKTNDNLSPDKLGDGLIATQNYLEGRWLLLRLQVLAKTMQASEIDTSLKADAQRLGAKGPSQAETAKLDIDLTRAIDGFLDGLENRIRNEEAQWPSDKPPLDYANTSLIALEAVRLDVAQTLKSKGDLLIAMARANYVANLTVGGQKENRFAGRDESVDTAMKSVKLAAPPPPAKR